jgi:hypothetical protein
MTRSRVCVVGTVLTVRIERVGHAAPEWSNFHVVIYTLVSLLSPHKP